MKFHQLKFYILTATIFFIVSCSPPQIEVSQPTPTPTPAPTPHPAKGAQEAAIRLYPDLAKKDSTFNRTFLDFYAERASKNPEFLSEADWPLKLARETAAILRVSEYPPTPTPVVATPTPTWFEERMHNNSNPLSNPAYNEKRGVARPPVIYDQYGNRIR